MTASFQRKNTKMGLDHTKQNIKFINEGNTKNIKQLNRTSITACNKYLKPLISVKTIDEGKVMQYKHNNCVYDIVHQSPSL